MSGPTFEQQIEAAVRGLVKERGATSDGTSSLTEILAAFKELTAPPLCGEGRITQILLDES